MLAAVLLGASCSSLGSSAKHQTPAESMLDVRVVSSRPDMVTGESALLQTSGAGTPTVTIAGRPVRVMPVRTWWRIDALPPGRSTIDVRQGDLTGSVQIADTAITGPVFSGPHLPLLACSTEENGLGKATDNDCSAPTKVDYLYRNAIGLQPLTNPDVVPRDTRQATRDGKPVPFVVRRERGVINRSVYWIDVLDPERVEDPSADTSWNGRLVYRFGGGCGTTYGQGSTMTSAEAEPFLEAGYAVATATFNTFQTQCNDVLSAETAMMVKSHFTNEFGVPVHTIGEGASGGAIQQHLILQNYPGILDASLAVLPFPDALSISPGVTDCGLLDNYYGTAGSQLTGDQRAAINGHAVPTTCIVWEQSFLEGVRPIRRVRRQDREIEDLRRHDEPEGPAL